MEEKYLSGRDTQSFSIQFGVCFCFYLVFLETFLISMTIFPRQLTRVDLFLYRERKAMNEVSTEDKIIEMVSKNSVHLMSRK